MKLSSRILAALFVLVAVAVVAAAMVLGHDSACGPSPALAEGAARMQAVVMHCYGPPEVLRLEQIAKPVPDDEQVLVRVQAAAANPLDWHYLRGKPYLMRFEAGIGAPKFPQLGADFAGTVEAVGRKVTRFRPGDEVFGGRSGSFAEYVSVRADRSIVPKPAEISFEQAAALPVAGVTALQALRDIGGLRPGQKVLINGASGGVGTFAVQIAKAMGAEVTGVCSTRNLELERSLSADHVIDYTQEDYTGGLQRYDLIVDNVGNHPLLEHRRVMAPQGVYVMVGGSSEGDWLGPMGRAAAAPVVSLFSEQKFRFFLAQLNAADLEYLAGLMQEGKLKSVIDRRYVMGDAAQAIAYLEEGHARGKIILGW